MEGSCCIRLSGLGGANKSTTCLDKYRQTFKCSISQCWFVQTLPGHQRMLSLISTDHGKWLFGRHGWWYGQQQQDHVMRGHKRSYWAFVSYNINHHSQSSKNKTPVNNSAGVQAGLLKAYLRKSKDEVVRPLNLGSLLWFTSENSVCFEISTPKTKLNLRWGTTIPSLITLSEYITL